MRIETIVISTQHDDFAPEDVMLAKIREDVENILIPRVKKLLPARIKKLFGADFTLWVNPTGKFTIGGPHGDTGLTGRKIIVDTYGGRGAHGGGAFSGKDSSKGDRSAAYATRHIAKNLVAAEIADEALVQVAYAIGGASAVGFCVNTFNSCKIKNVDGKRLSDQDIADKLRDIFDLRPYAIVKRFGLKNPIFKATAAYGHFGRDPFQAEIEVKYTDESTFSKTTDKGTTNYKTVDFFAWEKLDYVDAIRKAFNV